MDRRKKMSLFGGGPITSTSTHTRLRSARSRGMKGIIYPSDSEIINIDRQRNNGEVHQPINALSFDKWTTTKEPQAVCSDTHSAQNVDQDNSNHDMKKEDERISGIEIKDIEDLVDSSLVLNLDVQAHLGQQPKGTPISLDAARSFHQFLFGSNVPQFSDGWFHQGFEFNPPGASLSYGLRQRKGGPCGIIAVVQAYIIKNLLFERQNMKEDVLLLETVAEQQEVLINALCSIFNKVSCDESITFVSQSNTAHFSGIGNYYRSDGVTEKLDIHTCQKSVLKKTLKQFINVFFESDSGIICFLYSILLTKGIERIKSEMDTEESPFIGAHGYCTQEMVNLLLTGIAVSNTFDGSMVISDGEVTLKGISTPSELGLLSLFEHYGSISVGKNLKDPKFPIWVLCSESHFSVLFSIDSPVRYELHFYDELAKQEGPIRLVLSDEEEEGNSSASPIEKCVRTKWKNVGIQWVGCEPLL